MADTTARRRFRLLPPNDYTGWTPYAWLIYLPIFLVTPILEFRAGTASVNNLAIAAAGVIIFLVAYFRGFWVRGRGLFPIIATITALGMAFAPINHGSSVFFIYAATFAARLDGKRRPELTITAITIVGALTALVIHGEFIYYITATLLPPVIAGVSLHFTRVSRTSHRLRLAQEEIEHLAAVAERERIGRDLHDVLGHTLSLIVLKAELASKLAKRDPQRAAKEIRDVEQVSRKALQEVREVIRGYRPTLDDETARARSILEAASITAHISIVADALDSPREDVLAMALREAVTNIVRHSKSSSCSVRAARAGDAYELVVEDNGRAATAAEGSGLRAMRERVEALGGTVTRESAAASRGTRLCVSIPLSAPAAELPAQQKLARA